MAPPQVSLVKLDHVLNAKPITVLSYGLLGYPAGLEQGISPGDNFVSLFPKGKG